MDVDTADVRSDQIIVSYVKLFLNNKKKPQMDGLVRRPNLLGGIIDLAIGSLMYAFGRKRRRDDGFGNLRTVSIVVGGVASYSSLAFFMK